MCSERRRTGHRDKGKGMRGNIELECEKLNNYYSIDDDKPVLLLESISQEIVDAVITAQPNKVIALDKLFNGNDQLKINTALQMCDSRM